MGKKILQVTTINPTLGFLTEHIKLLIRKGNEVHVASNMVSELNEELKNTNVKVNQIDFKRNPLSSKNISAYRQIKELQRKEKYDIVHVHTPVAAFITRLALRNEKNVKIVYTAHGFHFYKGAPLKNWLFFCTAEKLAAKWTDIIITMNEEDYKFALNKLSRKRLANVFKVGGVGINIESNINKNKNNTEFKKQLGLKEDDFIISIIGELNNRKNQIQIIKAVEKLKDIYSEIKLLIVGNGDLYKYYEEYINSNNLQNNIILLGYRRDVKLILGITDVVTSVSFHEGLPLNLMEAMCNKKAIVCTNIRGNIDLVKNGENGFVVDVGDIEATIKVILKLYENPYLMKSMGEISFKNIQKFSENIVLKDMDDIYSYII